MHTAVRAHQGIGILERWRTIPYHGRRTLNNVWAIRMYLQHVCLADQGSNSLRFDWKKDRLPEVQRTTRGGSVVCSIRTEGTCLRHAIFTTLTKATLAFVVPPEGPGLCACPKFRRVRRILLCGMNEHGSTSITWRRIVFQRNLRLSDASPLPGEQDCRLSIYYMSHPTVWVHQTFLSPSH